ncbi:hypothetical protein MM221_11990 [Salipaludibacillus sp. LMS25]|jgi:hypothetical protein|uniref:hypothetical protein n=1 Tax=Salipaludibacillus sp. LMS25 TaxID=2924031 RepID=UPI0020D171A3|nr:hypothetical protein [Salipaludibacillus sp. LMS25]UTR13365.1 hypothetical protein MM221_11990 [Salipaludibacillus sp. LMS25]
MRSLSVIIMVLSVITFRSCDDLKPHDDVTLELDAIYSGGTLYLTPYIVYEGEDEATFQFGSSIAWIDKVQHEGEMIYEYEGEPVDVDQQTTMEHEDERGGFTIELAVEPGLYEVHMTANYFMYIDEWQEEGLPPEYGHFKIQTIDVQRDDD